MSKLWLIACHEYRRHVFQKRFIFVLLSLPALIAITVGLTAVMVSMEEDKNAVGYVDQAGLLADPVPAPRRGRSPDEPSVPDLLPLIPFQTEKAARAALESKHVQAYYVITEDYFETRRVELVYFEPPSHTATRQFWDFMQINRLDDLSPDVARRAVAGSNLIVRWPNGREFSARTFLNNFLPLLMGAMFITLTFMSSGYLMGAVVEEKENRTVEMLMTTLSPTQLMGGKVLGIIGIGLTQLVVWIALSGLTILIGGHHLGIGWLGSLSLDWRVVLVMAAVTLPTYVMFAGLLTALGATLAEVQEAQQVSGLLLSFGMMPVWFLLPIIIEKPHSPLTIGMTLFPTLALPTLSFRLGFSRVPHWQIFASVAISTACALGAVWLAGRAFRLGMLRYGQRLHWRELFGKADADSLTR